MTNDVNRKKEEDSKIPAVMMARGNDSGTWERRLDIASSFSSFPFSRQADRERGLLGRVRRAATQCNFPFLAFVVLTSFKS